MLLANGVWISSAEPPLRQGSAALFIDRDGVLIEERDYLYDPGRVKLEKGAAEAIAWARLHDLAVIVVTNQSGIGRGYFDWQDYEAVEAEIARQLAEENVSADFIIACPFSPDSPAFDAEQARWRKPGPAMLLYAAQIMGLDLSRSIMIGDKAGDIEAARRAGLAGGAHVATGHGSDENEKSRAAAFADTHFSVLTALDLPDAIRRLDTQFFSSKPR